MHEIEHVVASHNRLGEGPLWSVKEQSLYWVDIRQQRVERYHPASSGHQVYQFDTPVTALGFRQQAGFVAATARGIALGFRQQAGFVAATARGIAFLQLPSKQIEMLAQPEADLPHNRFNDGAVDPAGRFWCGTMYEGPETDEQTEGRLYRLDVDRSVHVMETGLTISNGLGWSPNLKTMYFTDTLRRLIYAYDYDLHTGSLENRRVFVDSSAETGYPDGMAVDGEGFVWSARWGGWKISRYDPSGELEREVRLPVEFPSSCAFGGRSLHELYITSASDGLTEAQRRQQPFAGDLLRLTTNIKGLAPWQFAG